jgi:spore coat polysaccharide biosynthesis predicted glycosyltransferase SpsG
MRADEKLQRKRQRKAIFLDNQKNKRFEDFRKSIKEISQNIDKYFYGYFK